MYVITLRRVPVHMVIDLANEQGVIPDPRRPPGTHIQIHLQMEITKNMRYLGEQSHSLQCAHLGASVSIHVCVPQHHCVQTLQVRKTFWQCTCE